MPRRRFIDKKNATTFQLVHRAQNDPRIHDADAPDMVFAEVPVPNARQQQAFEPAGSSRASQYSSATGRSKIKSRGDLESEFGGSRIRRNEGEAANYGIYYDDSEYDYMQHMKDLGSGGGESYFLEAPAVKKKGKEKMDLADMLRESSLDDRQSEAGVSVSSSISRSASDIFGEDLAPSEFVRKTTYQDQQNIPDAIKGFQPDMDPRLREVLEALEDEAYVDDDDDIFEALAGDAVEVDPQDWKEAGWVDQEDEDDGWESDDTIKASSPSGGVSLRPGQGEPVEPTDPSTLPAPDAAPEFTKEGDNAWLDEFNKFKKDIKAAKAAPKPPAPSDVQSSVMTGASALTAGGRRKKRKGAMTSTSGYSMSSSALHRTEGLTLLDQRFDKIEEEYAGEDFDDSMSMASGMTGMSRFSKMSGVSGVSNLSEVPGLRDDFDNIMDDFLGNHSMAGKRRVKKGRQQTGLEQLDEIRNGLGPARVKPVKTQKAQLAQFL
ncbi:low-temperature viability protein-like protein ltv1 [Sporormia fimetaria CBS 119925]|uniref:Low-temperature viability protein-like protein ltv1 n=1 Tax=Sporormia fimetaria CBS 119925 TaxID=1340428 RepID=A0A6A6VKM5_9PLEO|nr:low-temperature viability protein-like protein ltv1 [Sporormia fimetaria CBS 119925]